MKGNFIIIAIAAIVFSASTFISSAQDSATVALEPDEAEGILFMREEEKMARDVYLTFYDKWRMTIFQNIADSEQTHMDAVKWLIVRYGLTDPAEGNPPGIFKNQTFQQLYNQLTLDGSQSLRNALYSGALIEEVDIVDLKTRISQTDNPDILMVYENLMKGSRNHLRAFTATLKKQAGETYQPLYLSQEEFESIVSGAMEQGDDCGNPWSANLSATIPVKGTVKSVNLGFDQGCPSVVLIKSDGTRVTIFTASYYYMLENNFEIRVKDSLKVQAYPSLRDENIYVAATIKNKTTGESLTLRDEYGLPLWD